MFQNNFNLNLVNDKTQKIIDQMSAIIQSAVSYGNYLGIYKNIIEKEDIFKNIVLTCFSGEKYTSSNKKVFLKVEYPLFYQRKISSGELAKTSIIYFEKDNNYLRAQFPIDLLNRFTISFSLQDGYIVSSDSSKNCLEEINKSILKLTKLSLKRNKVNLLNNSIEHLIDQVKLLNLIEY